jgi:dihydropyrimidinase
MFGLYPQKGVIAPGSDADLVVYDPGGRQTISRSTHHMNMDYSAWEGMEIAGWVDTVMSRGTVIVDGGRYVGTKGHGRFLKRGLSSYLN